MLYLAIPKQKRYRGSSTFIRLYLSTDTEALLVRGRRAIEGGHANRPTLPKLISTNQKTYFAILLTVERQEPTMVQLARSECRSLLAKQMGKRYVMYMLTMGDIPPMEQGLVQATRSFHSRLGKGHQFQRLESRNFLGLTTDLPILHLQELSLLCPIENRSLGVGSYDHYRLHYRL